MKGGEGSERERKRVKDMVKIRNEQTSTLYSIEDDDGANWGVSRCFSPASQPFVRE